MVVTGALKAVCMFHWSAEPLLGSLPNLDLRGIDWVIVGGELGSGAQPMDPGGAVDLIPFVRSRYVTLDSRPDDVGHGKGSVDNAR
jgi:protein gp37